MTLDGTTIVIDAATVRRISEEAELRGFAGVIVACLSTPAMSDAVARAAHTEVARQLKAREIVPQDCTVRDIGLSIDEAGAGGLIVNYRDWPGSDRNYKEQMK